VQDEGNGSSHVTKIYQTDGLGRLASTCEVTSATQLGISPTPAACGQDIAATGFLTTYGYDTLGNLASVSQGGLNPRTYSYDMLSRVTQEVSPEAGTTTYAYDSCSAGDLCTRTAPKPNQTGSATVVTTYSYDALHRLTSKNYNDGTTPEVLYFYDQTWDSNAQGRLVSIGTYANNNYITSRFVGYDAMGRVTSDSQCTPVNCPGTYFTLNYSYDLLGDMTTATNGYQNLTYTYSYDAAARLTTLGSSWVSPVYPATLLTVNQYNPLGEVQQATLGNGIVRNLAYDHRGRLTSETDGSIYSFALGYAPDSNILTGNDSMNGNWTYGYDDFSRLASANKNSGQQTFTYRYDRYGNRWQQNAPQGGPAPQYSYSASNQITGSGVLYDAAGNITNDGLGNTYTYDAEGRVTALGGNNSASYIYNGEGHRVQSTIGSNQYEFIYDLAGHVLTTALGAGGWVNSEIYAGGTHLATYGTTTYFEHHDWLGTVRALSDMTGASVESCFSLAFGDASACYGMNASAVHFAGYLHDGESNLEHTLFRQLSTTQGRWTVPDPAGLAAVDPMNPQSWNRYAYVGNMPLSFSDPYGLFYLVCEQLGDCGSSGGGHGGGGGGGGGGGSHLPESPSGSGHGGSSSGKTANKGTPPNNACIPVSTLKKSAVVAPGWYAAYLASRAGAWLTGGTIGVGVGGGAGFGLGPKGTVAVGGSVSGSAVFTTDGLGNYALVISFTPPVQLSTMSTNPNWYDAGGAANVGVQITASGSLVSTSTTLSSSVDVNGSFMVVGFDWTPDSVSLQVGDGVGARVGGSAGGTLSLSIPICK
jgi:RHS repeat-associated protein